MGGEGGGGRQRRRPCPTVRTGASSVAGQWCTRRNMCGAGGASLPGSSLDRRDRGLTRAGRGEGAKAEGPQDLRLGQRTSVVSSCPSVR